MPNEKSTETLWGSIDEVVYHNDENDYTVLSLIGKDGHLVTAVGKIAYAAAGEDVTLYGTWVKHAEYGEQFSFESYERELPTGKRAILRYLSSRVVKGVGPVTAARLVDKYGEETFDVIEHHPEWLSEIPGISARKAAEIHDSFIEQTGIRALMMFCRDFFTTAVISRIYKRWGSAAVDLLKENPFILCGEIYGVSFEAADRLAEALAFAKDNPDRTRGGILHILEYNAQSNGHTCLPREKLVAAAVTFLSVEEESVLSAIARMETEGKLLCYAHEGATMVAASSYADAERTIAKRLAFLDRSCPLFSQRDVDGFISRMEHDVGIVYAKEQREAIHAALSGGVMILTGGPGTGKTTIVRALLRIFSEVEQEVLVLAPTGRAANRISEAAVCEAKTIHRALEMERTEEVYPIFRRDASCPLEADVIIVDECSMIDSLLMAALLRAVPRGTRLILIGDSDQLPSVGAGRVLCDLIDSEVFCTVRLKEIFRQSAESLIVTNAHKINGGEAPTLDVKDKDFFFLPTPEEKIPAVISDLVSRRLPKAYGEREAKGIQVITPSRRGRAGTEQLNLLLRESCNPAKKSAAERKIHGVLFREGDRVMQVRNNYDIAWKKGNYDGNGIFNGEIGVLTSFTEEGAEVLFDDRVATYSKEDLEELDHSYAITIHKSQGSEYPTVIIPLYDCPPMLATRNLLYTAVTRACRRVILVGRRDVVLRMVENDRHTLRYTFLPLMLAALREEKNH